MELSVHEKRGSKLAEQYDQIFVHIHRINDAITERQNAQLIACAIDDFAKSAEKQLTAEEELLKTGDTPELRAHLARRRFFAREINRLKFAFISGQLPLVNNIVDFLQTWLNYQLVKECRHPLP